MHTVFEPFPKSKRLNHGKLIRGHFVVIEQKEELWCLFNQIGEQDQKVILRFLKNAPKVRQASAALPALALVGGADTAPTNLRFLNDALSKSQNLLAPNVVAFSEYSHQVGQIRR